MALPNRTQVKARLRVENDAEDDDIDLMIASAQAFIEEFVGRPLTATEQTFVIECPRGWSGWPSCTSFFLPLYPVKHTAPDLVEITDADSVAFTDFRVDTATGRIIATSSAVFDTFPYTVTATVGLDLMPDYATRIEPNLAQAFLDLCADWYQRRNPGALAEGAGGGVITQWQTLGVPKRICEQLDPYRLVRAH